MTIGLGEILLVAFAGLAAAAINGVVGSGTLITYPVLLSLGLNPVVANGTNSVGLSPGGLASIAAYRDELRPRMRTLLPSAIVASIFGGVGAALVVVLPEKVFATLVPWLILSAVALMAVQPAINRFVRTHEHGLHNQTKDLPFWAALLGAYGGYFGAGQGIMYFAVLGLRYDEDVQQANAAKNLLGSLANAVAAVVFIVSDHLSWPFVVSLWLGSVLGGYYGGRVARRIPRPVLRLIVMGVGIYAAIYLFVAR